MGLLSRAKAFLTRTLSSSSGVEVSLSRGAHSATLTAWVGRSVDLQVATAEIPALARLYTERDYLIPVASYQVNSVAVTPQIGDRITETINGASVVFEVRPTDTDEPGWRYSDPTRSIYRVHVRMVT